MPRATSIALSLSLLAPLGLRRQRLVRDRGQRRVRHRIGGRRHDRQRRHDSRDRGRLDDHGHDGVHEHRRPG